MSSIRLVILAITLVISATFGQSCSAPKTSVFADNAVPFNTIRHPVNPGSYWGNLQGPYPTNQWYSNLILAGNMKTIVPHPYMMAPTSTGLAVGYAGASTITSSSAVLLPFVQNVNLAAAETLSDYVLTAHDSLSVTLKWTANGGSVSSPIVRGSPFVTMFYNNLTPKFTTIHAILSINGNGNSRTATGSRFIITMNNGQRWIMYTLGQVITLNWANNALTASDRFNGAVRLAMLPYEGAEASFDLYYQTIPTGAQLNFFNGTSSENAGTYEFVFETQGDASKLLTMALPHHMDIINSNNQQVLPRSYRTMKGWMTGLVGNVWRLKERFTNIQWSNGNPIPSSKRSAIIDALNADFPSARGQTLDPYWGGKSYGKMARLALIADELGQTATATTIRNNMINDIEPWLAATNTDPLRYDASWGGIVSANGIADAGADYGNGWYNDHHFHYGYFIYASAVIGKGNPTWLRNNLHRIMPLIKDYANPVSDSRFPQARHKDWFDGHSWASGLFPFGDAKNQESSSECVNAYYGIYLMGLALNDPVFTYWGQMLLATELRSTHKYWQITNDNPIYDAPFNKNGVVGVLWASKVDYATFFGNNVEYIHGIQYMPITPYSEEVLRPNWIAEAYPIVSKDIATMSDDWKGFVFAAHASIAPNTAWNEVLTLRSFDSGNTKTNMLHYVATRPGFSAKRTGNVVM